MSAGDVCWGSSSGSGSDGDGDAIDEMTPEQIDVEIARLQAEQTVGALRRGSRQAIIVINGCFCPVHAGHLRSLEQAKRLVESSGEFRVVAGYFAVAPDKCVRKKIGKKVGPLARWMTEEARLDMCRHVPTESGAGWTLSAAAYGGWKECGSAMVARYHSSDTRVFSVPSVAKGHVYKLLTSTDIRAELAGSGPRLGEIVDDLVKRNLMRPEVGERLKQWAG